MNMRKTNKGRSIDWEKLRKKNKNAVAVGNARQNLRGDIISSDGKVLKSKEEREEEYNISQPDVVRQVSIKNEHNRLKMATPQEDNTKKYLTPEEAIQQNTEKRKPVNQQEYMEPQEALQKSVGDEKKQQTNTTSSKDYISPEEAMKEFDDSTNEPNPPKEDEGTTKPKRNTKGKKTNDTTSTTSRRTKGHAGFDEDV